MFGRVLPTRIQNPAKRLRWSVLLKAVNYFCKTLRFICVAGFWICLCPKYTSVSIFPYSQCHWKQKDEIELYFLVSFSCVYFKNCGLNVLVEWVNCWTVRMSLYNCEPANLIINLFLTLPSHNSIRTLSIMKHKFATSFYLHKFATSFYLH